MKLLDRIKNPTPVFFKKVRGVGLALTAVAAAILTAPVSLPAAVISVAGYIATAGAVATAVSQIAVKDDQ